MQKNLCGVEYEIWVMTLWISVRLSMLMVLYSLLSLLREVNTTMLLFVMLGNESRLQELAKDRTWSPPINGCFRENVDNLFNPNMKEYEVGMVI